MDTTATQTAPGEPQLLSYSFRNISPSEYEAHRNGGLRAFHNGRWLGLEDPTKPVAIWNIDWNDAVPFLVDAAVLDGISPYMLRDEHGKLTGTATAEPVETEPTAEATNENPDQPRDGQDSQAAPKDAATDKGEEGGTAGGDGNAAAV